MASRTNGGRSVQLPSLLLSYIGDMLPSLPIVTFTEVVNNDPSEMGEHSITPGHRYSESDSLEGRLVAVRANLLPVVVADRFLAPFPAFFFFSSLRLAQQFSTVWPNLVRLVGAYRWGLSRLRAEG